MMKKLFMLLLLVSQISFAGNCTIPPELNNLIPKEDNVLKTSDGKHFISRSWQYGLFSIYDAEKFASSHSLKTEYVLNNYGNSAVRNNKLLECKFSVKKTAQGDVISFDSFNEWLDSGGYISRSVGEIVIKDGVIVSIDVKDQTSYKYGTFRFWGFKTENSFKY